MIVCRASSSRVNGQFIGITGAIGATGGGSGTGETVFSTFLFHIIGNDVLVAFGDWDLLCRL